MIFRHFVNKLGKEVRVLVHQLPLTKESKITNYYTNVPFSCTDSERPSWSFDVGRDQDDPVYCQVDDRTIDERVGVATLQYNLHMFCLHE